MSKRKGGYGDHENKKYRTKNEVMAALSRAGVGEARAEILQDDAARNLVLNSGSNVLLVRKDGKGVENTVIYVTERKRGDNRDGIGALGGLSERMKLEPVEFQEFLENSPNNTGALLVSANDPQKDRAIVDVISKIDWDALGEAVGEDKSYDNIKNILSATDNIVLSAIAPAIAYVMTYDIYNVSGGVLSPKMQEALVGGKDDVIVENRVPTVTRDIDIIKINTVMRELQEELGEIGITNLKLDPNKFKLIVSDTRDDNFIINIWDGNMQNAGGIYAVSPFCHSYILSPDDVLQINAAQQIIGKDEIGALIPKPLIEVLASTVCPNAIDGITVNLQWDKEKDMRYPHEAIVVWAVAAEAIKEQNPDCDIVQEMSNLARLVQKRMGASRQLDFKAMANTINTSLENLNSFIGVPTGTVEHIDAVVKSVFMQPDSGITGGNTVLLPVSVPEKSVGSAAK